MKLLGVEIDDKSAFDDHISTDKKLHALAKVTPYMNSLKKRILINLFFKLQFTYYPLVCMCQCRANLSKINRLHERYLRVIYADKQSSYEYIVEKGQFRIHSQQKSSNFCHVNV